MAPPLGSSPVGLGVMGLRYFEIRLDSAYSNAALYPPASLPGVRPSPSAQKERLGSRPVLLAKWPALRLEARSQRARAAHQDSP